VELLGASHWGASFKLESGKGELKKLDSTFVHQLAPSAHQLATLNEPFPSRGFRESG